MVISPNASSQGVRGLERISPRRTRIGLVAGGAGQAGIFMPRIYDSAGLRTSSRLSATGVLSSEARR